jgi:site-specific DNA-methyltransferase (adenine-specific)
MSVEVFNADSLEKLKELEDNSIDSVVTDPPYFLSFMGKDWDKLDGNIAANVEFWKEVLRVLKPGGHLLAFGHSRTHHRLYVAVEDAGFEIRDTIMWLYGSGFPKSHNISIGIDKAAKAMGHRGKRVSIAGNNNNGGEDLPYAVGMPEHQPITDEAKKWQGWGTALKPAHEPICLARKPLEGTVATNVLKHGVGGLNIDESRVGTDDKLGRFNNARISGTSYVVQRKAMNVDNSGGLGRWPANVVLDEQAGEVLGEQSKGASRFFYCAKVSKKERNAGCDELEEKVSASTEFRPNHAEKAEEGEGGTPYGRWNKLKNNHPTVKPKALMTYLIKLVTPEGGKILDPFMGSGSTGIAAKEAGFSFIGIEREKNYYEIAKARIGVE